MMDGASNGFPATTFSIGCCSILNASGDAIEERYELVAGNVLHAVCLEMFNMGAFVVVFVPRFAAGLMLYEYKPSRIALIDKQFVAQVSSLFA